jgi:hypothetical protein
MTFVLDLPVRRLRGNIAEIYLRCGVSRLGDVVFVGSKARVYCEVAPLVTCWCWLAHRDIAKAMLGRRLSTGVELALCRDLFKAHCSVPVF